MSDHPREAERHLKRIYMSNEQWDEVLGWSTRAELGQKIAPISAHFDALADRNLGARRWSLGPIEIHRVKNCKCYFHRYNRHANYKFAESKFRRKDGNCAQLCLDYQLEGAILLKKSALLDVPAPSSLVGFKRIEIHYVDRSVIIFLHKIRHLFDKADTNLSMPSIHRGNRWQLFSAHLWPIFSQGLHRLNIADSRNFIDLRTRISDCANLRVIDASHVGLFPEMPADDRADASDSQAMAKWLHTPPSDGRPKVLLCGWSQFATKLEGLIMEFVNAKTSVSYIICVKNNFLDPFELENEQTRERMTFQMNADKEKSDYDWLLKRGPILLETYSERQPKKEPYVWSENNLIDCTEIEFRKSSVWSSWLKDTLGITSKQNLSD